MPKEQQEKKVSNRLFKSRSERRNSADEIEVDDLMKARRSRRRLSTVSYRVSLKKTLQDVRPKNSMDANKQRKIDNAEQNSRPGIPLFASKQKKNDLRMNELKCSTNSNSISSETQCKIKPINNKPGRKNICVLPPDFSKFCIELKVKSENIFL